jgi:hypothetical protein
MKHLGAQPIEDRESDVRPIFGWIDVDSERTLAEWHAMSSMGTVDGDESFVSAMHWAPPHERSPDVPSTPFAAAGEVIE